MMSVRPRPRSVALLVGSLRRGGAETQLIHQALGMRQQDWDVTVICLTEVGDKGRAKPLRDVGVRIESLGLSSGSPLRSLAKGSARLVRTLRRLRPDVVECVMYHSHVLGVPIARVLRVPAVVSSFHVLSDVKPNVPRPRSFVRPLERLADRLVHTVICPSAAVREDVAREVPRLTSKLRVLPYGVPLPETKPLPQEPPLTLLVLANLHPYKGHAVLLEAFAEVLRHTGPDAVRLELAGSGSEELPLRTQAADLGIEGSVEFLGTVDDVATRLNRCAFTVLPSFTEALPVAVLESLAASRAVVATKVGGIPEALEAGGGILVPPRDPKSLADAILELVLDPKLAADLGVEGRKIVEQRFSLHRSIEARVSCYEQLGNEHR